MPETDGNISGDAWLEGQISGASTVHTNWTGSERGFRDQSTPEGSIRGFMDDHSRRSVKHDYMHDKGLSRRLLTYLQITQSCVDKRTSIGCRIKYKIAC